VTDKVGKVTLTWAKVADPTVQGYNVYRKTTGAYAVVNGELLPAASGTYTDTTVAVGTEYTYQVRAVYAQGESNPSNAVTALVEEPPVGGQFRRGDVDGSGVLDLSDPIFSLTFQFMGGAKPGCMDAADADDSGAVDLSDPIYSLTFQFMGGTPPPAPGPTTCGADPTATDQYTECAYTKC